MHHAAHVWWRLDAMHRDRLDPRGVLLRRGWAMRHHVGVVHAHGSGERARGKRRVAHGGVLQLLTTGHLGR